MVNIQVFGLKNSQATRAAQRFFNERGIAFHSVDLKQKALAPAEIRRFVQRFTLAGLIDTESTAYTNLGLKYLKLSETELISRVESNPELLRLPLVRSANKLAVGHDPAGWAAMLNA